MSDIDPLDRRALGVLSETVGAKLGTGSIVAREVNRAYRSGRRADLRTASAAFDALPGWQRSTIGQESERQARQIRAKEDQRRTASRRAGLIDTARDWRQLADESDRVVIPSPPRFLKPKPSR